MKRFNIILIFTIFLLLSINSQTNDYEKKFIKGNIVNKIIKRYEPHYFIYVKKKNVKLYIIDMTGKIVDEFKIAIGKKKKFERKLYQYDNGTPEGLYFVTEILSISAPTNTYSYKKMKIMNSVYFKASEGYHLWGNPDKDLGSQAYGPRFFRLNYPNEDDLKRYSMLKDKGKIPKDKEGNFRGTGGGIGIHGTNDPPSIGHRISSGCIRMHNKDVTKLDNYLKIGSPVYIEK